MSGKKSEIKKRQNFFNLREKKFAILRINNRQLNFTNGETQDVSRVATDLASFIMYFVLIFFAHSQSGLIHKQSKLAILTPISGDR